MSLDNAARAGTKWGLTARTIRLVSGMILMAFVSMHLVNLMLGLASLETMEAWRPALTGSWHSVPGELLLAFSTLAHTLLGLVALSQRRSFSLTWTDCTQALLGILTPPLLIAHVLTMRVTWSLFSEFDSGYGTILTIYWSVAPFYAIQQLLVVVMVWMHAAIGFYSWAVLRPFWPRIKLPILLVLFSVPILSLLGFVEAGKDVLAKLTADPLWRQQILRSIAMIDQARPTLSRINWFVMGFYWVAVAGVLIVWISRAGMARNRSVIIAYEDGAVVQGKAGLSILDNSLENHQGHAHICRGRGRCGTCRVLITEGREFVSSVTELERETLARLHAGVDVRLACQAVVSSGTVRLVRLLPPYADATAAQAPQDWVSAKETLLTEAKVGGSLQPDDRNLVPTPAP